MGEAAVLCCTGRACFLIAFFPFSHASAKLHTGVVFRIIGLPVAGPEQGLHCVTFHSLLSQVIKSLENSPPGPTRFGNTGALEDRERHPTGSNHAFFCLYICFSGGNGSAPTEEVLCGIDFKLVRVKAQSPIPTFPVIVQ